MVINLNTALTFMLVLFRFTGMFVFNPIFGRRNIPIMLSAALSFILAGMVTGVVVPAPAMDLTIVPLLFNVAKELLLGLVAGIVFQLFISVIVVGGEMIDMQLGISMSKAFDPGTNSSISVTSGILNAMYILIFFITNNHLTFMKLIVTTFDIIPVGSAVFSKDALFYLPDLFSSTLIMAMKLCLPIAIIEIIVTMAVGIIMRIIPQINVFVINIQFKLLIGTFVLVILVAPFVTFFENMILVCFERVQESWIFFLTS